MPFQKVLVAVDFSELSRCAFETSAALAIESGAALVLMHVIPAPRVHAEAAEFPVEDTATVTTARVELARWRHDAEAMGVAATTRITSGTAWHEIVEALRADRSFDLVVVGTHGHTGLRHVLLGSIAERIVRLAPCPVLVFRVPD